MKKGFTLAEVVMTLTFVGIVAAMTIPTMIHDTNKKSTIEQLKKSISTLNHVAYNAVVTEGMVSSWNWASKESVLYIMQKIITPGLNVGYMCSGDVSGTNNICTYKITGMDESEIDASAFETKSRVLLSDGSMVAFSKGFMSQSDVDAGKNDPSGEGDKTGSDCKWGGNPKALCGIFMVDVNGTKKPNMIGKDVFFLGLYASGAVLPYGANQGEEFIEENCSKGGATCAAKLAKDGWDVCYTGCKYPYPVKF